MTSLILILQDQKLAMLRAGVGLFMAFGLVIGRIDTETLGDEVNLPANQLPSNQLPANQAQQRSGDVRPSALSSGSFAERQRMTMRLWENRDGARESVQRAANDPDPEVSARARWILRQWRRGTLPSTPPEVAKLRRNANDPRAIETLVQHGYFDAATIAIKESAGTINHEAISRRLTSSVRNSFPILVSVALHENKLPELLGLIESLSDADDFVVSRLRMMIRLNRNIDESELLPPSSETWDKFDLIRRRRTARWLAEGEDDLMRQLRSDFEDSIDQDLVHQSAIALYNYLILMQRWQDAYEFAWERAERSGTDRPSTARSKSTPFATALWRAKAMNAAVRTGDEELARSAMEALDQLETSEKKPEKKSDKKIETLRWKCFAINGEFDRSLELATSMGPDELALTYLIAARPAQSLQSLNLKQDEIEQNLRDMVRTAVDAQMDVKTPSICDEVKRMIVLMRILLKVGKENDAYFIAQSLSEIEVDEELELRSEVLRSLELQERSEWVKEFAVVHGEESLTAGCQQALQRTAGDASSLVFRSVYDSVSAIWKNRSVRDRVMLTHDLLVGDPPEDWDNDADNDQLFAHLVRLKVSSFYFGMFSRMGRSDLSQRYRDHFEMGADRAGRFFLATMAMNAGRTAEAETRLRAIEDEAIVTSRQRMPLTAVPKARREPVDPMVFAKSVVSMYALAKRKGDQESELERLDQIHWMLCSPSTNFRKSLAVLLVDEGLEDLAASVFQEDIKLMILNDEPAGILFDWTIRYGRLFPKRDPVGVAKWFDLQLSKMIESDRFFDRWYFSLASLSYRWNLDAAIASNDRSKAERNLWKLLKFDLMDLNVAEKQLPLLREKGWDDLADQAMAKIMQVAWQRTGEFPTDANTFNNVAWVAAMNGVELDSALKLSQQAVRCQPEMAIYRDTMAEVLFRLGRIDEAIKIEQDCLLDVPSDWHFHKQIKRFQAGRR